MDTEALYWKIKEADEDQIFKELDRAIKEGYGKEVAQVATRVILNIRSTRDVFERECMMADREIELLEYKNKKLHKVINSMRKVMDEAPGEDD